MEENGTIPEDWGMFRANTECALEAGHVSKQWFKQFYPMLSEQMRAVRMKGLWGGWEGAIFPEFSTHIHCVPEDWEPPIDFEQRRGIDWGFSIDHPTACVWGARNSIGQWFIWDEYWSNDTSRSADDHMVEIIEQHPWPSESSNYYGVMWSDHCLPAVKSVAQLPSKRPELAPVNIQLASKGPGSVDEGIDHVKYLLKCNLIIDPDDPPLPRLFISKRCRHLISEMRSYRRHKAVGTGPNAQAGSMDPVKIADDTVDAARMMLFSEAKMSGMSPTTVARQHDPSRHGIHVESSRFSSRRR